MAQSSTDDFDQVFDALSAFREKRISLAAFRDRMAELGYEADEIDEFLDGPEDEE